MDSKKAYEMMQEEMISKESMYLCTEIDRALDRIFTYTDMLDANAFNKIKAPAINLLKEEIDRDMALLGVNEIDELGHELLQKY